MCAGPVFPTQTGRIRAGGRASMFPRPSPPPHEGCSACPTGAHLLRGAFHPRHRDIAPGPHCRGSGFFSLQRWPCRHPRCLASSSSSAAAAISARRITEATAKAAHASTSFRESMPTILDVLMGHEKCIRQLPPVRVGESLEREQQCIATWPPSAAASPGACAPRTGEGATRTKPRCMTGSSRPAARRPLARARRRPRGAWAK